MKKSEAGSEGVPQLVDENEVFRNATQIKNLFQQHCYSFDDLLYVMSKTKASAAARDDRIYYRDFEQAIIGLCGTHVYSQFQIRQVFKLYTPSAFAEEKDLTRVYIPIQVFKDKFFPPKTWKADHKLGGNEKLEKLQAEQMRRRQEMASDASDALSNPSMDLDDIMQGRQM